MALSYIGHKCNISSVRTILTPSKHVIFSAIDEHGILLDTKRLNNENNADYKKRLLEVFTRRSNSTYQGLINGITRELGLEIFDAMWVNPRTDADGDFVATDPYIRFNGAHLELYSDYAAGTLDKKIDRYEPGGNYEHYIRLMNEVNTSSYFHASIYPGVDIYTRSMTIINQSNREEVPFEEVPCSTKFRLGKERIVDGSVYFSDRNTFRTEVETEGEVSSRGTFHVDYKTGIVRVYTIPISGTTVRYKYVVFPFLASASPVVLNDITNDNFKVKMFLQILQDDGTYAHGLPTKLGSEIINELYTVFPLYYGV